MTRFNARVPADFDRVVARCLDKIPARRYQLPQELLVDLKAVLQGLNASNVSERVKTGATTVHASSLDAELPATVSSVEAIKDSGIFINCALIDDQPISADQRGWVSQFQRHLEVRLEQLWGDRIKIGRYPMPPGESPVPLSFFDDLSRVKTMISVVSPSFMKAEGCRREVSAFYQHTEKQGGLFVGDKARLLKMVKTPVEMRDMPVPLGELFGRLGDCRHAARGQPHGPIGARPLRRRALQSGCRGRPISSPSHPELKPQRPHFSPEK